MKALLSGLLLGAALVYSAPLLTTAEETDTTATTTDNGGEAATSTATSTITSTGATATDSTETSCGSITGPTSPHNSTIETVAIEDCGNPFSLSGSGYPHSLRIDGAEVADGDTVSISPLGTVDYQVGGSNLPFGMNHTLYRHEGADFVFVPETFFYAPSTYNPRPNNAAVLVPGTYTLVSEEIQVFLNQEDSFLDKLARWLIPIAHAQYFPSNPRYAITFTLVEKEPEPTGASSVLFLPGIQASRLYTGWLFGIENRIWEPNINSDVRKLEMTEDGVSVNDVYTRDVLDEIYGIGSNIYKSFLAQLETLEEESIIADFIPFAYDWRYDVRDVVQAGVQYENEVIYLKDVVNDLANDSYTNQVTIVAHSNGGLVAKALMIELEKQGLEYLIDKIVFLGTPQMGTPKAIGSILHGLDLHKGFGAVINQRTAREVLRNLPASYGLLPSKQYLESIDDVLITGEPFGTKLTTEDLDTFYTSSEHGRGESASLHVPIIANTALLSRSHDLHEELSNWRAPATTEVYEIAGVGLPTINRYEYRLFPCSAASLLPCENGTVYKPYPRITTYGDETVVATSALAYAGDKFFAEVDLKREGDGILSKTYTHEDFSESPAVKLYIEAIIKFRHQNETLEIPSDIVDVGYKYTMTGIHSPVNLIVENEQGQKTGADEAGEYQEIDQAYYFELGGSKYIILPNDGTYEFQLSGYDTGVYSITIDQIIGSNQEKISSLFGATTSELMVGGFTLEDGTPQNLSIDVNGDGTIDYIGDFVNESLLETVQDQDIKDDSPTSFKKRSSGTLARPRMAGEVAGASISVGDDKQYLETVAELLRLVKLYLDLISKT